MKANWPLTLSLLGNVALIATIVCLVEGVKRPVQSTPQASLAPFRWSQIESADYAQYIANLRTIGCPEPTIQVIVSSELADVFARERAELQQHESQQPDHPAVPPAATSQIGQQLQELEHEQKSFLTKLLPGLPVDAIERVGDLARRAPTSMLAANSPAQVMQPVAASGVGAKVGSPDLTDPSIPQVAAADRLQNSNASNPGFAPADTPMARPARRELFTIEEQRYRALWGWGSFYYEPNPNQ